MIGCLQFLKFVIVGISNTLISEGIYCVLVYFRVPYILSYFIGFSLSVINAYYWSNKYVFVQKSEGRVWWKVLLKTYVAYLWGFLVSAVLLVIWIDVVRIEKWMLGPAEMLAKVGLERMDATFLGEVVAAGINLVVTVPMNYFVNKYWAYKDK